jgi:hypothetical protein
MVKPKIEANDAPTMAKAITPIKTNKPANNNMVFPFRKLAAKSPLGINCNDLFIEPSTLHSFVFLFNYFPFTEFREKIQKKDNIANTVSPFCCRPFPIACDDFVVVHVAARAETSKMLARYSH